MDKETLGKAKSLEGDIEQMKDVLAFYKNRNHPGADDDGFHFELSNGTSSLFAERKELPARLNERLMAVVEEELHRTEAELEALGSWEPSAADLPRTHGDWQRLRTYTEGDTVTGEDGVEYVYRNGRFVKARRRLWPEFRYDLSPFIITILDISAMSIISVSHWDTFSRIFTEMVILNAVAIIGTVSMIMEAGRYSERKEKGRKK